MNGQQGRTNRTRTSSNMSFLNRGFEQTVEVNLFEMRFGGMSDHVTYFGRKSAIYQNSLYLDHRTNDSRGVCQVPRCLVQPKTEMILNLAPVIRMLTDKIRVYASVNKGFA